MITLVAVLLVICCALIIFIGAALMDQLKEIDYGVKNVQEIVSKIYTEQPYNSWFKGAYEGLGKKLDDINDHLTTEIACLATKNNEDIKRMKGDYVVGDILRFDGTRWRVFGKDILDDGRTRWKLFGENGEEYRIYTDDAIPADLEFLGHRDLSFD